MIGMYIGKSLPASSSYGTAGSIVVLIEFTRAYANSYGSHLEKHQHRRRHCAAGRITHDARTAAKRCNFSFSSIGKIMES
jgi:hypothetical protein